MTNKKHITVFIAIPASKYSGITRKRILNACERFIAITGMDSHTTCFCFNPCQLTECDWAYFRADYAKYEYTNSLYNMWLCFNRKTLVDKE